MPITTNKTPRHRQSSALHVVAWKFWPVDLQTRDAAPTAPNVPDHWNRRTSQPRRWGACGRQPDDEGRCCLSQTVPPGKASNHTPMPRLGQRPDANFYVNTRARVTQGQEGRRTGAAAPRAPSPHMLGLASSKKHPSPIQATLARRQSSTPLAHCRGWFPTKSKPSCETKVEPCWVNESWLLVTQVGWAETNAHLLE